jgi:hypothetical protein
MPVADRSLAGLRHETVRLIREQSSAQTCTEPVPMQVRRAESGEVSMCGIDELLLRAQSNATVNCSCRRDHRCFYGKDALAPKSFRTATARGQLIARAGPWKDEWQTALDCICTKLRHWQVSKTGEDSCKVPGLFQRLRLARRKCWGSTDGSTIPPPLLIVCLPLPLAVFTSSCYLHHTPAPRHSLDRGEVSPSLQELRYQSEADRSSHCLSD